MPARTRTNGDPHPVLGELSAGAATRKTVGRFPKKLKIELPYNPAAALLGIYPGKNKKLIQKAIGTPVFIAAIFTIAQT